jgi:hypothetical protein
MSLESRDYTLLVVPSVLAVTDTSLTSDIYLSLERWTGRPGGEPMSQVQKLQCGGGCQALVQMFLCLGCLTYSSLLAEILSS